MPSQRPAPLLWVMLFAYFTFGLTGVLGALTPEIILEFHLTRYEAGLLPSVMLLAVAFFAIPSGLLADRIGARRVILAGVFLMGLGCISIYPSHHYNWILCMFFAIGAGTTMLQTSGSPMIQQLDLPQNYHRNLTITIACATFGGFIAIFLLAFLRGMGRPWQFYYLLFSADCLLLLSLLALSTFPPRAAENERIQFSQIRKLLRDPILLSYGLGVYLYSAAEIGMYFWIPKFFEDVHHVPGAVSNLNASTVLGRVFPSLPALVFALFFGMQGAGRILGGAVMKRLGTVWVLRFCSVMSLVSLIVAVFGSSSFTAIGFIGCGLFTSVLYPLLFSGTINSFENHHGTISGLLCTAYIASAVVPSPARLDWRSCRDASCHAGSRLMHGLRNRPDDSWPGQVRLATKVRIPTVLSQDEQPHSPSFLDAKAARLAITRTPQHGENKKKLSAPLAPCGRGVGGEGELLLFPQPHFQSRNRVSWQSKNEFRPQAVYFPMDDIHVDRLEIVPRQEVIRGNLPKVSRHERWSLAQMYLKVTRVQRMKID
ncbi:MAG: MFS transporter [Terriglobia bacterium]